HARSLYVFDVMRRYLKFRGFNVIFVRNITDIDDKIIGRANDTKREPKDVSEEQIQFYHEDLKALGVRPGDVEPKATDNIPDMITHIQGLIDKGIAYSIPGGDVYFD